MKTPETVVHPAPSRRLRLAILPLALAAGLGAGGVQAALLNYQFELSALHSDNINLSENNQAKETVLIPRLEFDFREEGSSVEIQARGAIERRHYSGHEFDVETRSEFAGQLNWSLFPQRLNFVVEDYLSEEPINFRDGRYPGNLQQVNVFLAGPTLYARFSDTTRFQLDLRGADTYAEISPGFDSRRYSAAGVLQHDLTETSKVSLHLASTRADFDDATTVDYTRKDGFVRYEGNLRRVTYQLDAGRSRLERSGAADASNPLLRADLQWQINEQNRLRLRARRQFADEVQDLIVRLSDPDEVLIPDLVASSDSLVSGGVYKLRANEADYRLNGERLSLRARAVDRRLEYLDRADSNRTERSFSYRVAYRLRPLTSAFVSGLIRKRDFLSRDETDIDHVLSVGIEQQRTRHWGWRAEVFRNHRNSNLADPVYKENAVQLTAWWKR
jgi:hypothetical protein